MLHLTHLWFCMTIPGYAPTVTREMLGHLGGNAYFSAPNSDRLAEVQYGMAPTTRHSAIESWRYRQ